MNGKPEKIRPRHTRTEFCCDCGLAHLVGYDIENGEIVTTFFRDDWETAKQRKKDNIIVYRKKGDKKCSTKN